MNTKRYLLSAVAAYVFMFAFDFVWHGLLLNDQYEASQTLWRPEADMGTYFPVALAIGLALAFLIAFIFTRNYENRGLAEGAGFGLFLGVFLGLTAFGIYPYLAMPFGLAALWFVGGMIEGVGTGLVIALVYRPAPSLDKLGML